MNILLLEWKKIKILVNMLCWTDYEEANHSHCVHLNPLRSG